jgi:type II secretory pathway component PulF
MAVPSPARRRAVTLLAALPWPVVLFQFLTILPGYDKIFREFHWKVDDFTGLLLNVSSWLQRNSLAAFLNAFGLMAVSVATVHTVQSVDLPRRRRFAILLFVFGFPSLVFVVAWVGVLTTHRTLVENLNR